jgi:hypothetical protein
MVRGDVAAAAHAPALEAFEGWMREIGISWDSAAISFVGPEPGGELMDACVWCPTACGKWRAL